MSFLNGTDPGLRQTRTPTVDTFAAGVGFTAGSSTYVTLSVDCGTEASLITTFDGITQHRDTYSYDTSNRRVTFDAAIPTGVSKIECTYTTTIPATTPADGSVTQAKLGGEAVNEAKLQVSNAPTNGQFLSAQSGATGGLTWAAAGGGFASMQVFTSSGTWTKPTGINLVKVYVIGGGGGGGNNDNSSSTADTASGGGAGGMAVEVIDVSSISSETVTIGAGGAGATSGGAQGSTGGTSSFGSHCTATGGTGGKGGTNGSDIGLPGPGGAGSGGNINVTGMNGFAGSQPGMVGGAGGSSLFGNGGNYTFNQGSTETAGQAGSQGGGGGAGTQSGGSGGTNSDGGAGGAGIIVVEEYK